MPIELTPLLNRFVSHMNNHDSAAFTACFADDAVVEDEGQTHHGRAAIETWISKAFAQAAPILDLEEAHRTATGSLLSGMVSGTFPGSPIKLHYHLAHDEAHISHLRCTV